MRETRPTREARNSAETAGTPKASITQTRPPTDAGAEGKPRRARNNSPAEKPRANSPSAREQASNPARPPKRFESTHKEAISTNNLIKKI